jgi:cell division protein FtsI/penicillin-binding protein 2
VIDGGVADWVRREALSAVVSRGTGKKAAIPGYEIFGKTGTAQKLDPATGEYSRELHVSSFVCGAPVDDPRVLVLISVDQPTVSLNGEHFGGSVAAPAAGELLHKALLRLKVPANEKLMRSALLPDDFKEEYLE